MEALIRQKCTLFLFGFTSSSAECWHSAGVGND